MKCALVTSVCGPSRNTAQNGRGASVSLVSMRDAPRPLHSVFRENLSDQVFAVTEGCGLEAIDGVFKIDQAETGRSDQKAECSRGFKTSLDGSRRAFAFIDQNEIGMERHSQGQGSPLSIVEREEARIAGGRFRRDNKPGWRRGQLISYARGRRRLLKLPIHYDGDVDGCEKLREQA